MRKIKNIIFDWSGTLTDDFECTYIGNMGVFRRLGIKELSRDDFRREFDLPYMDFYRKYTDSSKEEIDRIFHEEYRDTGQHDLYPGVEEVLRALKNRGVKLVILSTCGRAKIIEELERLGISELFADVRGGVYEKGGEIPDILKTHGFSPDETAFVGDMKHDIEAGNSASVMSVAITSGYQTKEKLAKYSPRMMIEELTELENIIGD